MDLELILLRSVTTRLPAVRGMSRVAGMVQRFYARKPRATVTARVFDFRMRLDPLEHVDSRLLFAPQLYERASIRFLRSRLRPGDVFLDAGANIGFYALVASRCVGAHGLVLAVEADPKNHQRLCENLTESRVENVRALNLGVADVEATLPLGLVGPGFRGSHSFVLAEDTPDFPRVDVPCQPLLRILQDQRIGTVHGAKFDIEGYEFRVLSRFFQEAPRTLYPRFLILEDNLDYASQSNGHLLDLVLSAGYRVVQRSGHDYLLALDESTGARGTGKP